MSRHEGTVLGLLGVIILIRIMESSRLGNAFGVIFGRKPAPPPSEVKEKFRL